MKKIAKFLKSILITIWDFILILLVLLISLSQYGCSGQEEIVLDRRFQEHHLEAFQGAADEWFWHFPSLRRPVRMAEEGEEPNVIYSTRIEDTEYMTLRTTKGTLAFATVERVVMFMETLHENGNQNQPFEVIVLHELGHHFGFWGHLDGEGVMAHVSTSLSLTEADLKGFCKKRKLPECKKDFNTGLQ
jgi:predicted Zn-dependent protease